MKNSYTATWKPGFRGSAIIPAIEAEEALEAIRKKNSGELDPQNVVDTAAAKRHKLHRMFEWDDSIAANKHRVEQARSIIRSIVVERAEKPGVSSRKYELTRSKQKPRTQVYASMEDVMLDPEARAELLQRALAELLAIRRRYTMLQELSIVFRSIDDVLETVEV